MHSLNDFNSLKERKSIKDIVLAYSIEIYIVCMILIKISDFDRIVADIFICTILAELGSTYK